MRVDYDRPLTRAGLIALLAHFAGSPYRDRLEQIAAHDAALRAENAALLERIALDNAVCLCGCAAKDHEDLGEDGEQCENEDHECLRVAPAVLAAMQRLRAEVAAMREALRHAARELQYIREAGRCDQGSLHVSGEGLACIALAESLLGPMRDWPEEPNAGALARAAEGEGKNNGQIRP